MPTVGVEADAGLAEVVHVVASRAGLDLDGGVPEAAVPTEAGAGLALDDAIGLARVAAVHPDGGVGAAVVLGDAEGGHGVARHAREAVPLPVDAAVARGLPVRAVDPVVRVPPGLVQADVGRAGVQGCDTHREQLLDIKPRWLLRITKAFFSPSLT